MDMVGFAVVFEQLTVPLVGGLGDEDAEPVPDRRRQAPPFAEGNDDVTVTARRRGLVTSTR